MVRERMVPERPRRASTSRPVARHPQRAVLACGARAPGGDARALAPRPEASSCDAQPMRKGGVPMNDPPAPLCIRLTGPATGRRRLPWRDLAVYGGHLQAAVDRVALVLLGRPGGMPGRRPAEVAERCTLEVVATGGDDGVTVACDLPPRGPERSLFGDLGEQALHGLVAGLSRMEEGGDVLPSGYDRGVLLALRGAGQVLRRGVDRVDWDLRLDGGCASARHTPATQAAVQAWLRRPELREQAIEGRLLMADLAESRLRCRIHPPLGRRPILCRFDEGLAPMVRDALAAYVRVYGVATVVHDEVHLFAVHTLQVVDPPPDAAGGAATVAPPP